MARQDEREDQPLEFNHASSEVKKKKTQKVKERNLFGVDDVVQEASESDLQGVPCGDSVSEVGECSSVIDS